MLPLAILLVTLAAPSPGFRRILLALTTLMGDLALWSIHCASRALNLSDRTLEGVVDAEATEFWVELLGLPARGDEQEEDEEDDDCASLAAATLPLDLEEEDRDRLSILATAFASAYVSKPGAFFFFSKNLQTFRAKQQW